MAIICQKRKDDEMHVKLLDKFLVLLIIPAFVLFFMPAAASSGNSCIDCHKTVTPFTEVQMQFNQIRIEHLERGVTCSLACHEDKIRNLTTSNYQQWSESLHAMKGVACDSCHGGDPTQATEEKAHAGLKNTTDPGSPVYYTNVPATCGKCHSQELANFENSTHYQRLESLQLAPTCTTCHVPHTFTVLSPEDFRTTCGTCHSVYTKVAPYDVPLRAEDLLSKVNRLKFNIQTASDDIYWAKENGTDVTQAEVYRDNALNILDSLAPMWHEFNLTHFENEIDAANAEVTKAEAIVKPSPTPTATVQSAPGFAGLAGLISLLAVTYLLRRK